MNLSALFAARRSDEECIARAAAGDTEALRVLFDRYSGKVLALATRVLAGSDDAQEVVQDTFIEVWRKASTFDVRKGTAAAWISAIARNRSIDRLRSRRVRHEITQRADTPQVVVTAFDEVSERQIREHVANCLALLPSDQRRVIELAYFDGLSQAEIAERTGDPLGTIKGRARAALKKLSESLGKERVQ